MPEPATPLDEVTTSGFAGGLEKEPLKAACTDYHSSVSRSCSMR